MSNDVTYKSESGFTLIELSIVLVIIGLIVGGILTGQDLIKAAEQRATIAQIEKYNTAVNTFRNKYGYIPGDIPWATSNSFSLTTTTLTGGGDGNGLIESSGSDKGYFLGEPVIFWNNLSLANLIDGAFGTAAASVGALSATGAAGGDLTSVAKANGYMPPAKLGRSNSINVISGSGANYFMISGFGAGTITAATGKYGAAQSNNLTPMESWNMDKKVDDGLPTTGSWVAFDTTTASGGDYVTVAQVVTTPAPLAACVTASAYVQSGTNSTSPNCSLRIKFN